MRSGYDVSTFPQHLLVPFAIQIAMRKVMRKFMHCIGMTSNAIEIEINDLLLVLIVAGMVSPLVDTDVGRLLFELVRGHF